MHYSVIRCVFVIHIVIRVVKFLFAIFPFFLLFPSLFCYWFVLSGEFKSLLIFTGIFCSFFLSWRLSAFVLKNRPISHQSTDSIVLFKSCLIYLPWLFLQIIASGVYVAKKAWSLNKKLIDDKANIVFFKTKQQDTVLSKTLLAHSVTLTPGTATISFDKSGFYVHCLTQDAKSGVDDIQHRVNKALTATNN